MAAPTFSTAYAAFVTQLMGRKWKRKSSATTFQTQTKVKLKRSKLLGEMWTGKRKKEYKRKRKPINYPSVSAKKPFIVHLHPICFKEREIEAILKRHLFHWLCLLCGHMNTGHIPLCENGDKISVSLFLRRNRIPSASSSTPRFMLINFVFFGSKWSLANVNNSATRLAPNTGFILIFSGTN